MTTETNINADRDIGQVISQTLNFDTGAGTQGLRVPGHVALTATMIDRVEQLRALQRNLRKRLEERQFGPLLVVLIGDEADFHRGFALRYELLEARKRLDRTPEVAPLNPLLVLSWPRRNPNMDDLLLSFAGPIPTLEEDAFPEEVIEALQTVPESISFSHYVKARHWNDAQSDLVERWLNFVESEWPQPEARSVAIGFLCLQTMESEPEKSAEMQNLTERLEKTYESASRILILPKLTEIERIDVEEWEPAASERLGDDFQSGLLAKICSNLFKEKRSLRYEPMYCELLKMLEARYTASRRVQFAEE